MGRYNKGTCKSLKVLLTVLFAAILLGAGCINNVDAAEVFYYEQSGYGWKLEEGKWNYIKEDGTKVVNWHLDGDGKWYFMNNDGIMQIGMIDWNGQKFFLGANGAMLMGWQTINGAKYYFRPDNGDMFVGTQTIDGKSYTFGADGKLLAENGEVQQETVPEVPATPDVPTAPEVPAVPEVPVTPEITNTPDTAYTPDINKAKWVLDANGRWFFYDENGALFKGWLNWKGQKYFLKSNGEMQVGWMTFNGATYYFRPGNGDMFVGSQVIDGQTYDFGADGKLMNDMSGWKIINGDTYFFDSTGKPVTGVVLIDDIQYGFTAEGKLDNSIIPWNLVLVNYNNSMPENFKLAKKKVSGYYVDANIAGALSAMIKAAKADGVTLKITSAYRTLATQERLYKNALNKYLKSGLSYEAAVLQTSLYHAEPGKSEHNLGLAIDFIAGSGLNEEFANTAAGIWLKEHAYEYGFILRYEEDTTDITRIAYEPWHYRFVGVDAARDIVASDVCFEKYFLNYYTVPVADNVEPEGVQSVPEVQQN